MIDNMLRWLFFATFEARPTTIISLLYLGWVAHKYGPPLRAEFKKHRHTPMHVETHGVNQYFICECGSKRVQRGSRGYSPVLRGWTERWDVPAK